MVATKLITASELLALGDDARIELIEGEPIEVSPTGLLHMIVVARLNKQLTVYSIETSTIHVWGYEGGFLLQTNPDSVLAPDIAVVTNEQARSLELTPDGFCPIPPTLVIEVKSPSDRESEIARKLAIYLEAGVREVWWVRPVEKQMSVHRPDRAPEIVGGHERFTGSDVLPGFELSLPALFDPSPGAG